MCIAHNKAFREPFLCLGGRSRSGEGGSWSQDLLSLPGFCCALARSHHRQVQSFILLWAGEGRDSFGLPQSSHVQLSICWCQVLTASYTKCSYMMHVSWVTMGDVEIGVNTQLSIHFAIRVIKFDCLWHFPLSAHLPASF